ncbi:hypothetical protein PACTADRAFT_50706 [Pachysolen tannophilus NRRL Y-2460]|uniref:AP-1 complex subunit gamma n=1 Tax=Pachysolen tannophilus NRRL Y-2460 TaxID=669874 RepID=A0A1E4TT07_PACTA|nr:hypothetical protein PACTADRAFT_50706 [Pachysolen tannophilus NRRL Y-2460]
MVSSLKSFIKSVRAAKTIADERSIIRKESAKIRTSFRDVNLDHNSRRVLISKLLYLYILGEPTHFGQVECIKLLASNQFKDKKLGYMAASLLLDENQEVLTLLTNSLNIDLNHPNQFVVGLALTTLGNIASPALARDLYQDIEKIIQSENPFLRRKSAMVASRCVEKSPDLSEIFLPKLNSLINNKNHGSLLGVLKLIQTIYEVDESSHDYLVKNLTAKVLQHLKNLLTVGYSPEYDVNGIPDPFLFCSLLLTLRLLFEDIEDTNSNLELFNDLLTQIASKIDSSKNSGHAILYEAVKTIFHINSEPSLRVLGVNILGRFLSAKDNNTKYVALNTLLTVISYEPQAVQRHRSTIVSCLQDADISIRRRALELSFGILNEQNIRVIAKEILIFLENSDNELKSYITGQLTLSCDKYSPNPKWHFETLIKMLKSAGNYVTSDIISNILASIMQNQDYELSKHIVLKLYQLSLLDTKQYGLNLICSWCLGEYGELLINSTFEDENKQPKQITESSIVNLLTSFLNSTSTYKDASKSDNLILYILTASLKLSIKFKDASEIEKLRQILISKSNDINLEIQIRSMEYLEIFAQPITLKKGLLEKMPAPPIKKHEAITLQRGNSLSANNKFAKSSGSSNNTNDLLLDLMGSDDVSNASNDNQKNLQKENTVDLLSDIFGNTPGNNSAPTIAQTNSNAILDLFPSNTSTQQSSAIDAFSSIPISSTIATPFEEKELPSNLLEAYSSPYITISFLPKEIGNSHAIIESYIVSNTPASLTNFNFLVAVPKSQKLQISPMNENSIRSKGGFISQSLNISGKPGGKLKLRVKVSYNVNGDGQRDEQFDFNGFSATL